MSHKFTFKSVSVEAAIKDAAEAWLPSGEAAHGMAPANCLALAQLAVNRFLEAAPEYKDEEDSSYKFALAKGGKTDKRAEWKRVEKTAGGLRVDEADDEQLLGNKLGWFDQHVRAIEKSLGNFTVELPESIHKSLIVVWNAALKQRAARATVNA